VRHGEHVLRGQGLLAGRTPGIGLSELGRAEMAAVAERLAAEKIQALYASPLQRTTESALILAERLALSVRYREDVIEVDFGEWTGLRFDMVRQDPRWPAWHACRSMSAAPGGETMRQVQERTLDALAELHHTHKGVVVIVSHGDVIRAALLFALGMPLDFHARIEIGLASISTINFDGSWFRVQRINECPRP
jgi:probable phosphoglycerate mutase